MRVALLPQLAQLAQTVVGHDLAAKIPAVVGHEDLARDVDHQVHPAVVAVEEDVRRVGDESSEYRHTLFRQTGDFDFTVGNRKSLAHIDEMMSPGSTPGKKEGLMNRTASEKVEEWKEMGFSPKS